MSKYVSGWMDGKAILRTANRSQITLGLGLSAQTRAPKTKNKTAKNIFCRAENKSAEMTRAPK